MLEALAADREGGTRASSVGAAKPILAAASIGYLVPTPRFDGIVHSVYARACNIRCGDTLLTLLAPGAPAGPTTLLLGSTSALDLRTCFRVGDAVARRGTRVESDGSSVELGRAILWKPPAMSRAATASQVSANLAFARARLAARPRDRTSVLQREARAACTRLECACRDCDFEGAKELAATLIGWGGGLTPAGDDFLVGLLGSLGALAEPSVRRRAFLDRLGAALAAGLPRTTPVAAHYLRLAACGHFTADVHALRSALLSTNDIAFLQRLLDDALTIGATSGADLVTGMLSGISAWYSPRPVATVASDD